MNSNGLLKLKGHFFSFIVLKLAWNAHNYHIWKERNLRLHQQTPHSTEAVLRVLVEDVRLRLLGFNIQKSKVSCSSYHRALCHNWNLSVLVDNSH